jgi:hypothetical protein
MDLHRHGLATVIARHEAIHGLPRRSAPRSDITPVIAWNEAIHGLPRRSAPRSDEKLPVIASEARQSMNPSVTARHGAKHV